jgi:hypothetical protein
MAYASASRTAETGRFRRPHRRHRPPGHLAPMLSRPRLQPAGAVLPGAAQIEPGGTTPDPPGTQAKARAGPAMFPAPPGLTAARIWWRRMPWRPGQCQRPPKAARLLPSQRPRARPRGVGATRASIFSTRLATGECAWGSGDRAVRHPRTGAR